MAPAAQLMEVEWLVVLAGGALSGGWGSGGVSKGLGLGVALEVGFTSGARTVVVSADP